MRAGRNDGFRSQSRRDPGAAGQGTDPAPTRQHSPRARALSLGAKDFLTKPFDITEVKFRIHNLLETRMLYRRLEAQNRELEDRVRERTKELVEARQEILDRLAGRRST